MGRGKHQISGVGWRQNIKVHPKLMDTGGEDCPLQPSINGCKMQRFSEPTGNPYS
jgi:hypothetical protein